MDPQDPRGIADAVLRLYDSGKQEEISQNNREKAESYSLGAIVEEYRKVYLEASGGNG